MADDVLELAAQFRAALLKQDTATLTRLVSAYQQLYARLKDKIDLFLLEYGAMAEPTKAAVSRLARYGDLIRSIEVELTKFSTYAEVEISTAARAAIDLAIKDATAFLKLYGLSQPATLPTAAIESMLAFLKPDGALYERLGKLAGANAARVADTLLEGVGLGYNPIKVAKLIENYMGGGLTDALRMARTTQLWAYREGTRANYIMNSDVIGKWVWFSELDDLVCPVCFSMHGSEHDLSETLDGHHNCRCAMLPLVIGAENDITPGSEQFDELSEAQQRNILGQGKFEAFRDGKITLSDLVGSQENDIYGRMIAEKSLSELLGE